MVNAQQSIILILKKVITTKKLLVSFVYKMTLLRATDETVILEQMENFCYSNLYTSDLTFSETAYDTLTDNVEYAFRGREGSLGGSTYVRRMQKDTRNLSE